MQRAFERFLIFTGVIYYLFVFPHGIHGDGTARFVWLEHFLTTGESLGTKYPLIGPLISSPLYFIGKLIKTPHWWLSRFNTFIFLGFLALLYRSLRSRFSEGAMRRLILMLMVGTMYPMHITDYYGEVFSSTMACLSLLFFLNEKSIPAYITSILSVMNMPASLVATAFANAYYAISRHRARHVLIVVAGAAAIALENQLRFGSAVFGGYTADVGAKTFSPYSGQPRFSFPLFFGLLSLLFSFGKGLVFYTPGFLALLNPYRNPDKQLQVFIRAMCFYSLGLILVYAKFWSWYGGWFWGPRFMLFVSIPGIFLLHQFLEKTGKTLGENVFALLLLALSVWVGTDGVSFGMNNLEYCATDNGLYEPLCFYMPEFSALWRPFIAEKSLSNSHIAFLIFFSLSFICLSQQIFRELNLQTREFCRCFWKKNAPPAQWKF